jgi:hypothetical protein
MFGAKQQVHTEVPATNKRPAARRNSSARRQLGVPVAGSALPVVYRPFGGRVERKLNMSLHYFFLCLLAGLATFLAIGCIQKFCRPKTPVASHHGIDEQMIGAKQQIPNEEQSY